jgi:hypothetical protein
MLEPDYKPAITRSSNLLAKRNVPDSLQANKRGKVVGGVKGLDTRDLTASRLGGLGWFLGVISRVL